MIDTLPPVRKPAALKQPHQEAFYTEPLLKYHQEQHEFRKLHYFKAHARRRLNQHRPNEAAVFAAQAIEQRKFLMLSNGRCVKAVTKKIDPNTRDDDQSFLMTNLPRIVDFFDWRRGLRFSSYCMVSLRRNLQDEWQRLERKNPSSVLDLEVIGDWSVADKFDVFARVENADIGMMLREHIWALEDPRHRLVVLRHYGLIGKEKTCQELGEILELGAQRVRQLRNEALDILRQRLITGAAA
jgi:DNA-directed RNA polymerase specialized sigma subunit